MFVLSSGVTASSGQEREGPEMHLITQNAFDVTSVRPSDPAHDGFSVRPDVDNFSMRGGTVRYLVQYAFGLHDFQIEGATGWVASARYDVAGRSEELARPIAKPVPEPTWETKQGLLRQRLRSLLAERLRLTAHTVLKEQPIYALVVSTNGPRLQEAAVDTGYTFTQESLKCSYSSMDNLSSLLSDSLNRIVINETGLTGTYSFTLNWKRFDESGADNYEPSLVAALRDQLGLKLIKKKSMVEVLMIDHVERPTAN